MEKNVLSEEVFNYLKAKAPEFLKSYAILANFYETMTNSYTHKVWRDGRLVLTPVTKKEDDNSVSES